MRIDLPKNKIDIEVSNYLNFIGNEDENDDDDDNVVYHDNSDIDNNSGDDYDNDSDSDSDSDSDNDNDNIGGQLKKEDYNINYYNDKNTNLYDYQSNKDLKIKLKRSKIKFKKSRIGCSACKERKIKCDQKIPICSNCEKKHIQCPYLMMTPYQIYRILESQNRNDNFDKNTNQLYKTRSNQKSRNNEYIYNMSGSINLNNEMPQSKESMYHTHEMENVMLSASMRNNIITNSNVNNNNNNNSNYVPLKTSYEPDQNSSPLSFNELNGIPLYSNTKVSNKIFNISNKAIISHLEKFISLFHTTLKYVLNRDFASLKELLPHKQLDMVVYQNFIIYLSISQIFHKLARKSALLLSMDYYKNTLLKQKMLPYSNYMAKLAISCECENESVISIDEITKIIKNEYLPHFHEFGSGSKNLFLGSFALLDDCLAYHFKNGLKYNMNLEESEKAIKLVGIFSTGMYSIIMERSRENVLMTSTNVLSSYIISNFKKLLIKNYCIKVFDEIKYILERSSSNYVNNVNYENLKIFLEEHSKLLKINLKKKSLLGFNNSYLIRISNSFKSIIPFDLSNLMIQDENFFKDKENIIILNLFYYTLSEVLDALIPGIKNVVAGFFSGLEWDVFEMHNINKLMKIFRTIENKKLILTGIFLIRIGRFFRCQWTYYKGYLNELTLDNLLDEDENISIHQRYLKLLELKEKGIADSILVKSFFLDKGQFIRRWNYPNSGNLKPRRIDRVSANKIMNHFKDDEDLMIEDFTNNNNGFFSMDHNILIDIPGGGSITKDTTYIDGEEMKMLWKVVTYVRINNL